MKSYTRILTFAGLAVFILFTGCARQLKKLPDMTETEIWKEVHSNIGVIRDFKGEVELKIESGIVNIPLKATMYFRTPDWLTVRTYGPIGMKLVEASLRGEQFQVYSPFTNEFVTGSLDSVDLATAFKLPVPNLDLRSAWTRLFTLVKPASSPAEIRKSGKYYILVYSAEDGFHEIWVNSKNMLIDRENLTDKEGKLLNYISLSKYKKRHGVRFPRQIEIGDIAKGVKLSITTTEFAVNGDISDSEMMLSVPTNVNRTNLGGSKWR